MTTSTPGDPVPRGGLSVGRILLIVFGSLLALIGLAIAAAGGAVLFANETMRDSEGFFTTRTEMYATATRALRSEDLSIVGGTSVDIADGDFATIRLRATPAGARPLFVGIARAADADAYLRGVAHGTSTSIRSTSTHVCTPACRHRPRRRASRSGWLRPLGAGPRRSAGMCGREAGRWSS